MTYKLETQFLKMKRIEQEAVAEAVGMTRDGLADVLKEQRPNDPEPIVWDVAQITKEFGAEIIDEIPLCSGGDGPMVLKTGTKEGKEYRGWVCPTPKSGHPAKWMRIGSDGHWYEFQNNYWGKSAERVADEYRHALQHCDPFQVTGVEHPGRYYYDKRAGVVAIVEGVDVSLVREMPAKGLTKRYKTIIAEWNELPTLAYRRRFKAGGKWWIPTVFTDELTAGQLIDLMDTDTTDEKKLVYLYHNSFSLLFRLFPLDFGCSVKWVFITLKDLETNSDSCSVKILALCANSNALIIM